ncbi:MAG: hypothetical protein ACRCZF_15345 [Gemmataceae bacterium]
MRYLLLAGWLMLVPVAYALHMGPGQKQKALDIAATHIAKAEQSVTANDYAAAVEAYDAALSSIPPERTHEVRHLRIERAKAQMLAKKLPEAREEMAMLVDELQTDPKADPKQLDAARSVMANSHYYTTWLMRLEGLSRDEWEPEIESARQSYKLLADDAARRGDQLALNTHQHDLESAIRLARMDLGELQGLPLPSQ